MENLRIEEPKTGTWYKLKDDSWGVKVRFEGVRGDRIAITNSKGETKYQTLGERAAKFDDAELWRVE
jgi:hypothetical protein